jgi:cholesterol transport system auxiliary component
MRPDFNRPASLAWPCPPEQDPDMQNPATFHGSRLSRARAAAGALSAACAFGLAGCAGSGALPPAQYDFGPAPAASAEAIGAARLKVLTVSAPDALDTRQIAYRLAYADAQRVATYRDSRWVAPPAQLLTERLRGALAEHETVLENGADSTGVPVLKVDLLAFEQVFDAPGRSHAEVAARATLSQDGRILAQRSLDARAPGATPDAAGGAQALAAASDALIGQLVAWSAAQQAVLKP